MLILLPKGVQTKYLKLFLLRFFPFATGVNTLSYEFFEKLRKDPNWGQRLGGTDL
jgi:hypothetical protein